MEIRPVKQSLKERIFFKKYSLWDKNSLSVYGELIKNQTRSEDELFEMNWRKRKNIVRFVYENIPFYKEFYSNAGFHPDDLKKPEDFSLIPVLLREHIRDFNHKLICEGVSAKHMKCSTTGGTTGMPVKVFLDRRVSHAPLGWRMLGWWGVSPADDIGILWRRLDSRLKKLLDAAIWWPTKQLYLNASQMSLKNVSQFVKKMNQVKPPILHGYVGAIHHLANFLDEHNMKIHPPKAVWVTCSPLSEVHRSYISGIFGAPVYDQYGSCEVYWLSSQCSQREGHHIFSDYRHLEFTDHTGKELPEGETGNILVTDFENRVFPIVRYDIGDMGRALKKKCPCGITLPLMDSVKGKSVDLIKLPDGTCISDMNVIFDDFPELVKGFQVVQKSDYSIVINYIPSSGPEKLNKAFKIIKKRLLDQTGNQAKISFQIVDHIPHIRGKLKYIISELEINK